MPLSEKIKKKACPSEIVTVLGDTYLVTGKSLNDAAAITAKARQKDGKLNGEKLDRMLLEACVSDPEDKSTMTADEWGQAPRAITGPLMTVIMSLCGFDREDLERSPKDSSSTAS